MTADTRRDATDALPGNDGKPSLAGKIAVVTGAGRGIGAAIARAFGAAGAEVFCVARTRADIEATAAAIREAGGVAHAVPADVCDRTAMAGLAGQIAAVADGLDIAVLNAGGNLRKARIADGDADEWLEVVTLNMHSLFFGIQTLVPLMRRRGGGRILFTGSAQAHNPSAGNSAYCSAKAGARMLARVAATELVNDNITVNEFVPGPTLTDPARRAQSLADPNSPFNLPHEGVKQPEDVVPLVLMLASYAGPGPTGQVFSLARR